MNQYDAILIPGGGLTCSGDLPPWVISRLQKAIDTYTGELLITLSAGTTHKPPPTDQRGFPIFEAKAAAEYLFGHGIPKEKILCECCSYDTIGNAFFARLLHVVPMQLSQLLVITSDFHMPRTQAIFQWIFGLDLHADAPRLSFFATPNDGLTDDDVIAREQREAAGIQNIELLSKRLHTMRAVHEWLYTEHAAYAVGLQPKIADQASLRSY